MKPPPLAYVDPATMADALSALEQYGPDAKILAGGQSLIPMLNFRLARPTVLIDLNRIPELQRIAVTNEGLVIGAMTRQADVEQHEDVRGRWGLLVEALSHVGHPQIRNRGTIGGSLAHNDPAAEMPAVMLALDASLVAQSSGGVRRIGAGQFFSGYLTTALRPNEVLTEVRVPYLKPGTGWGFAEVARRHGDFALAAAVAVLVPGDDGVAEARVVVTGVGDGPARILAAEEVLLERGAGSNAIEAAAKAVATAVDPQGDVHGTAGYRRRVVAVMARRAMTAAAARMRR